MEIKQMNILAATGNIGKDAEIRHTPAGDQVAQFSFALSSGYGEKAVTTWLNCSLWGKRAETLAPMLLKGTQIAITGELTNRSYADKSGVNKFSLELRVNDITLLGKKQSELSAPREQSKSNGYQPQKADASFDEMDSSIPF
jgi:single-strand DNA-binding protein